MGIQYFLVIALIGTIVSAQISIPLTKVPVPKGRYHLILLIARNEEIHESLKIDS